MDAYVIASILLLQISVVFPVCSADNLQLKVVTVATAETDGYRRFMRSANMFNLDVQVVGMGEEWKGGDVVRNPGGGHKINLLKPVIEKWKAEDNMVVMFVDSYDVVFTTGEVEILEKFKDFKANVVFSAEGFCWPDETLAAEYPRVGLGKRFLCSGGFIGFASDVWNVVSDHEIKDEEDDQLYYTRIYLDADKRTRYNIRLDHRAHIFQNLNGAKDEIELKFEGNRTFAYNSIYDTKAVVYHGNGASKVFLNFLTNYIPGLWNDVDGCTGCQEGLMHLPTDRAEWPSVTLAVFIEQPTPFLPEVLEKISQLDYPKDKITLWVHNAPFYHEDLVSMWYELVSGDYKSSTYIGSDDNLVEPEARRRALMHCVEVKCEYLFSVDSLAMLDNPHTLWKLIEYNRSVLAPMLVRPYRLFSNFWGDVASNGFYARSRDYQMLVERNRLGIWNVPFISEAILFNGSWLLHNADDLPTYASEEWEPIMEFCSWMREKGHFMYVSNLDEFGHLLNADNYETNHLHNDMYQLFDNKVDWERKYLHQNWSHVLEPSWKVEMPCPDVYWYPLLSDTFAKELVEEMEHFGQWSGGKHEDERISGGYENVPTRDIHMNQIGYEDQWLEIIRSYVVPVQIKVFPGYYSRGNSFMNFVVKYCPEGQNSLRPHHDSSTFTINVALNQRHVDYEGGGCHFVRQNCSVRDTKVGWTMMHPGRLTHYHEGLPVTKGNRYIMISFIDP